MLEYLGHGIFALRPSSLQKRSFASPVSERDLFFVETSWSYQTQRNHDQRGSRGAYTGRFFGKRVSQSVGARVAELGWVGLDGRPLWGAASCRLHDAWAVSPHPRATLKAPNPSTQPPSPLRNPGLRLKLMSIGGPFWSPAVPFHSCLFLCGPSKKPTRVRSRGVPKESQVLLEIKRTEQKDQVVRQIRKATVFRFSHDEPFEATVMERGFQPLQADLQDAASFIIWASGPEEETLFQLKAGYQAELAQLAAYFATGSQRRGLVGIDKGLRPEALGQIPDVGIGASCPTRQVHFADQEAALQFHQRAGCSPASSMGRRAWYHAAVPSSAVRGDRTATRRSPWLPRRAGHRNRGGTPPARAPGYARPELR